MTTLATAHIPELDVDLLVTIWDDGAGEIAHRPGRDEHWVTWSPPIPLDVAS